MLDFGNRQDLAKRFLMRQQSRATLQVDQPMSHNQMIQKMQTSDLILAHKAADFAVLNLPELEGMSCAKSVVCRFEYPEANEDPPPVLVARTTKEVASHILRLLDDPPARVQVREAARARVMKYHDINRVAESLIRYYQQ